MKNSLLLSFLLISTASFAQIFSATDSVVVPSSNNYDNHGRGFRFTPNVKITLIALGKGVPDTIGQYTWVIWEFATQNIIHEQVSKDALAGQYIYEPIDSNIILSQGVEYVFMMYCDNSPGAMYYYGSSSQINSNLTYGELRYCNNCLPTVFPTSSLSNYHYGVPDFHFVLGNCNTITTDVQTACDSYTWIDGVTYTSSNSTATQTFTNTFGCDSVIYLNLTIKNSTTGTDVQTACDTYTWIDSITYAASNDTATHTLTNAAGCDSVITLNLTINNSTTGTDVQTACDTYTWIDSVTYTVSNDTATHTLTNAAGCDSVVTLDLTIDTLDAIVSVAGNTLTAQPAGDTYQWMDCDSGYAPINGEINQDYSPVASGSYAVAITLGNCVDTSSCQAITVVGIPKLNENDIRILPNPTSGVVTIEGIEGIINIYDIYGRLVATTHGNTLDISQASTGIYFIRVVNEQGRIIIKKIVKE